jgi:NodT family efflux transporter outer membrane factor (OMF) lipoprotein
MLRPLLASASALAAALALAACNTPGVTPPPGGLEPQRLPSAFTGPVAAGAPVWPADGWWAGFGSEELDGLVATARTDNLDLAQAADRVLQAQAQSRISRAALFPSVDLQASAQRIRTGGRRPSEASAFGASLDASYQLDLWGRARAGARAADDLVHASAFAQQAVALTVTANVANTYLDVLALRQRIAIAKANVEAAQSVLDTVSSRVRHGAVSPLDLAQQQAALSSLKAVIPALEEQERDARYVLAILLGRPPEGFDVRAQNLDAIAPPPVAPGLPAELLRRRPDLAEAEANLASAHANVEVARAAFLPQISLTGSGGLASAALGSLLSGRNIGWSIGSSLLQPIFDGGQLKGQFALSRAREQELAAAYQGAALNAFADVETNLGQASSLADQALQKTAQAQAAAEALRIAELQYREGVADLLSVLTAEQSLFTAQDQLVQIKLARLQAVVGLYQALGGGWSEPSSELALGPSVQKTHDRVEARP